MKYKRAFISYCVVAALASSVSSCRQHQRHAIEEKILNRKVLTAKEQRHLYQLGDEMLLSTAVKNRCVNSTALFEELFTRLDNCRYMTVLALYHEGDYGVRQEITERFIRLYVIHPNNRYAQNFIEACLGSFDRLGVQLLSESLQTRQEENKQSATQSPTSALGGGTRAPKNLDTLLIEAQLILSHSH